MTGARYGPVEFYLIGLPEALPDPTVLAALTDLADARLLRLLDLVLIRKSYGGELTLLEAEEIPGEFDVDADLLGAAGLAGHEDIEELAAAIPAGSAALLVAVELVFQRELAVRTAESGATLLGYERIPAPVVNALMGTLTLTAED